MLGRVNPVFTFSGFRNSCILVGFEETPLIAFFFLVN